MPSARRGGFHDTQLGSAWQPVLHNWTSVFCGRKRAKAEDREIDKGKLAGEWEGKRSYRIFQGREISSRVRDCEISHLTSLQLLLFKTKKTKRGEPWWLIC